MTKFAITDDHISTLCDVARSAGTDVSDQRKRTLSDLIASGFVATDASAPSPRYKLTPAGQAVLDERGVGANES